MSERGRDYEDNPKAKQGNKAITIFLLTLVLLLGGALAVVTLAFFKQQEQLATKSTVTPAPPYTPPPAETFTPAPQLTPSPTATPTPSPVVSSPSPTATASPSVSPQPSNSLSANNTATEYKNTDLPGYFPSEGFKAPPSDLSRFKKGNPLLKEMVISGQNYITPLKDKMLVQGQLYYPVFSLYGSTNEQRVGFELDGLQKAVLLQFGLQDLTSGNTNLTYLIRISVDGKLLWANECRYGKQQLVSVPLDVLGAKSLVIEYLVTEMGGFSSYNLPRLYMTKAELLYE